jgi:cobalt/nickel transport system ATP-binding protein
MYIDIKHLSFSYNEEKEILTNISFSAENNESIGIVGANGAGKSTLLKLIVGLFLKFQGDICIDGLSVEKSSLTEIREEIGYVFQDSNNQLFMSTVFEDVAFAMRNYGASEEEIDKRVDDILLQLNIFHLKHKYIHQLSGGEKKIVSIATALSMSPKIILMDEPSIELDPRNRRNLINILNSLKCFKIIASHDLDMILETCQRVILISNGKIISDGNSYNILSDKALLVENGLELQLCMCNYLTNNNYN